MATTNMAQALSAARARVSSDVAKPDVTKYTSESEDDDAGLARSRAHAVLGEELSLSLTQHLQQSKRNSASTGVSKFKGVLVRRSKNLPLPARLKGPSISGHPSPAPKILRQAERTASQDVLQDDDQQQPQLSAEPDFSNITAGLEKAVASAVSSIQRLSASVSGLLALTAAEDAERSSLSIQQKGQGLLTMEEEDEVEQEVARLVAQSPCSPLRLSRHSHHVHDSLDAAAEPSLPVLPCALSPLSPMNPPAEHQHASQLQPADSMGLSPIGQSPLPNQRPTWNSSVESLGGRQAGVYGSTDAADVNSSGAREMRALPGISMLVHAGMEWEQMAAGFEPEFFEEEPLPGTATTVPLQPMAPPSAAATAPAAACPPERSPVAAVPPPQPSWRLLMAASQSFSVGMGSITALGSVATTAAASCGGSVTAAPAPRDAADADECTSPAPAQKQVVRTSQDAATSTQDTPSAVVDCSLAPSLAPSPRTAAGQREEPPPPMQSLSPRRQQAGSTTSSGAGGSVQAGGEQRQSISCGPLVSAVLAIMDPSQDLVTAVGSVAAQPAGPAQVPAPSAPGAVVPAGMLASHSLADISCSSSSWMAATSTVGSSSVAHSTSVASSRPARGRTGSVGSSVVGGAAAALPVRSPLHAKSPGASKSPAGTKPKPAALPVRSPGPSIRSPPPALKPRPATTRPSTNGWPSSELLTEAIGTRRGSIGGGHYSLAAMTVSPLTGQPAPGAKKPPRPSKPSSASARTTAESVGVPAAPDTAGASGVAPAPAAAVGSAGAAVASTPVAAHRITAGSSGSSVLLATPQQAVMPSAGSGAGTDASPAPVKLDELITPLRKYNCVDAGPQMGPLEQRQKGVPKPAIRRQEVVGPLQANMARTAGGSAAAVRRSSWGSNQPREVAGTGAASHKPGANSLGTTLSSLASSVATSFKGTSKAGGSTTGSKTAASSALGAAAKVVRAAVQNARASVSSSMSQERAGAAAGHGSTGSSNSGKGYMQQALGPASRLGSTVLGVVGASQASGSSKATTHKGSTGSYAALKERKALGALNGAPWVPAAVPVTSSSAALPLAEKPAVATGPSTVAAAAGAAGVGRVLPRGRSTMEDSCPAEQHADLPCSGGVQSSSQSYQESQPGAQHLMQPPQQQQQQGSEASALPQPIVIPVSPRRSPRGNSFPGAQEALQLALDQQFAPLGSHRHSMVAIQGQYVAGGN